MVKTLYMAAQPSGQPSVGNMVQVKTGFLMLQYLLFACLGLCCSYLLHFHLSQSGTVPQAKEYSLEDVRHVLQETDCSVAKKEAQVSPDRRDYLSSKLRYQFDVEVENEMAIGSGGHCRAKKFYGLYRHGTRFPTAKHMARWENIRTKLSNKLVHADSAYIKCLQAWTNPLYQMVNTSCLKATGLAVEGMKEEYCIGQRTRQRFPDLFSLPYSSFTYDFYSTNKERAITSALSFSEGLFGDVYLKNVVLKSLDEEKDNLLRYYDMPCPAYDNKLTNNASYLAWYKSFLDTDVFKKVVEGIQHYFDPDYWKLEPEDVATFYQICIHEMSLIGHSCWCDLFDLEHLSVLQYNADLKAYWVKGSAYKITGQRSVNLIKFILDFFVTKTQPVALSFAHAETILPLLSLLDAFPVTEDLKPDNYEEQKSRTFKISRIVPYSGNIQLVLYDCHDDKTKTSSEIKSYVRLLVNEHPIPMGLCGPVEKWAENLALCPIDQLVKKAYGATKGFADLSVLCME